MITGKKFVRRLYENTALAASRQTRVLVWFWTRRGRKSTNLGSLAFDEMSGQVGRDVIAASASLLLGSELVGMTLTATEQASIVAGEASAMRTVFEAQSGEAGLDFQCADSGSGKIYQGMTAEDFASLYKSSRMEMRLYFDRTAYSRLRIIAPNPATARGWGGTVIRDEAGYTPAGLESDLRVATKPIIDTDPSFKIVYASNLCPDDRHPFFEDTLPPPDLDLPVNPAGNFYRGQTGMLIHRVTLADAYAAGHVLYDDRGTALTYEEFCAKPGNKLGLAINYQLIHESGGSAAIDLRALLTSQQRGARQCGFVWIDDEADFQRALRLLADLLPANAETAAGMDVATTTSETSNPSSVTITESRGVERIQRLVVVWKEKKPQIVRERLLQLVRAVRDVSGRPMRRFCIDASNERYFAEETRDILAPHVPVELVINGTRIHPPGYRDPIDYKTYLGDIYSAAINENRYSLASAGYLKTDHRLVIKNNGRYECTADNDGRHGDTFDSGKLAEYGLTHTGGAITDPSTIRIGGNPSLNRPAHQPRRLA